MQVSLNSRVRIVQYKNRRLGHPGVEIIEGMVGTETLIRVDNNQDTPKIIEDIIVEGFVYSPSDIVFIAKKDPFKKAITICEECDLMRSVSILLRALKDKDNQYFLNKWAYYDLYHGNSFIDTIINLVENRYYD